MDKMRKLTRRNISIGTHPGDVEVSRHEWYDPNLPEISVAPAMSIRGVWSDFEEKEATVEVAYMGDVVDWNNGVEASAALRSGKVPPRCSVNDAGALVVPDDSESSQPRGHSIVTAWFGEVVTASGKVLKSREETRR
jgi:hypothetical protein